MSYIKSRKHGPAGAVVSRGGAGLMTGLALSLLVSVADATDADSGDATTLSKVQVEATAPKKLSSPKFTAPLAETTQTIQVISEQVLKEQGATTLTEAMRNVPGVGTFNAGEGNGGPNVGDALYMRGFDVSNSIFVDGVRDLGSVTRDMFNIESVEVTKGAAGTDNGRSSPAGSINLVTKQPTMKDSVDASIGGGSGPYQRSTVDWNQSLGHFAGGTAFRLNVMGQDSGVAGREQIKNKGWGIAPSIGFGLNTDTRVYVDFLHVKQNNVPDAGESTVGLAGFSGSVAALSSYRKVDTSNYYGSTDAHNNSTSDMVTVKLEHDFDADTRLTNTVRWGRNKVDYLAVTAGVPTTTAADASDWTITRLAAAKQLVNDIITNQTNISSKFSTGSIEHSFSGGVEVTRERQTNYGLTKNGSVSSVNLYDPQLSASGVSYTRNGLNALWETDTAAAYAFDTMKLSDRWQVNLGLRLDHYKTTYDADSTSGATHLKADGNLLNYKAGVLYKVSEHGNIYVNYALSQQPPGSTSSFGAYTLSSSDSSASNPDMKPQKARTYELGTKWELFDQRLLLTGALFRTEVDNEVYENDDGTYSQIGKKRVQGVELTATGEITNNWHLIGGYTHQKTRIVTGAATAQDGSSTLPYAPDNAFSLWSTYRTPIGLTVGGGARYSGAIERQAKLATTPYEIPSYWVFDALASYQVSRHWDVQLNIYNLFNKKYITAINYLGYRYTPGVERSARLTVNLHF